MLNGSSFQVQKNISPPHTGHSPPGGLLAFPRAEERKQNEGSLLISTYIHVIFAAFLGKYERIFPLGSNSWNPASFRNSASGSADSWHLPATSIRLEQLRRIRKNSKKKDSLMISPWSHGTCQLLISLCLARPTFRACDCIFPYFLGFKSNLKEVKERS